MRFTKTGSVRFVGHLDLMRFFQKAIRRAGLNVAYSKGYSPHQLMGFASPLSVGATTDGDHIDVEFEPTDEPPEALMERLNTCMTDEVFVTAIWRMPDGFKNSMSMLESAAYMVTAKSSGSFPENYRERFEEFLRQDSIIVLKKTKKSEREIDLKPAIMAHAYDLESFETQIGEKLPELHPVYTGDNIFMKLPASSDNTVKPEQVMEAFFSYCNFEPEPWSYQIHRCQQWFTDRKPSEVTSETK
ncbi:MAG: DUF2344 domain-containing protein [Eubacterium sp.]|nr:DUF2344 domain-containing protein [Eubacterium sp.]